MKLFTTGDILKLIKVPAATFDDWCRKKTFQPIADVTGTGCHRRWTFTQAVGFVVANRIRTSIFGCSLKYFGATVNAFGAVDEEWLLGEFENGRRHFVHPLCGTPHLSEESTHAWTDAQEAFEKVTAYIAAKQPRETVTK